MQVVRWAEEYGFHEAWFSEHHTVGYERWNSPELQIAAAARETSRLRLGTAANLLPYHNPIALALRLMQLDHQTRGRLMVGFGAGAFETDAQLFGTELPTQNHEMLEEAQVLIRALWADTGEGLHMSGKYFSVDVPPLSEPMMLGSHWRPYQEGGPRVAWAGFSPKSSTLRAAGVHGDIPLSISMSDAYLAGHWATYRDGAESTGRTPDRHDWRVVRDVIVAETDDKATELALSRPLRRQMSEWIIPRNLALFQMGFPPGTPVEAITHDVIATHSWVIGSPETVVEKLTAEHERCGGYGNLLVYNFDFHDEPEGFRRHLELLATEVVPALSERIDPLLEKV
jgi:alkanesulfonate monooxygenase SsuD/methylene tetrahydromethanopterin reductase-like flavin-dependent oxidoreductase (luciferase family)